MNKQWFDVDRKGLSKQVEEQPKGRLIGELVQNALDEPGVSKIAIKLALDGEVADLSVEDDSSEGFRDLSHAYTLFAESYKRNNPEQRGQYNLGEKFVLAVCEQTSIATTKGIVSFDAEQGRIENPDQKRERGSVFSGQMKMSAKEYEEVCQYLQTLLLPEGIIVSFNGEQLQPRKPIKVFDASLETLIADDQGVMRPRVRKTQVSVHEAQADETASRLYEMGLPVVETGDKWHVSVAQKLPVNKDRDNVKPAYLRAVRTAVLNAMLDQITQEDANQLWVRQASSDANCSDAAIKKVLDLRFGEKRAAFDPNDPEANKAWVAQGGTLVYGPMMNPQEWKKAKEAGAITAAGKLCPTAKPYGNDPAGKQVDVVTEDKYTDSIKNIVAYSKFLGQELLGEPITVTVVRTTNNFLACYAPGNLDFNLFRLGHRWFEQGVTEVVDALLIHEYAHHVSGDHLSEEYHDALCQLGAKSKRLALEKPEAFKPYQPNPAPSPGV